MESETGLLLRLMNEWGCSMDKAMERLLGDKELYLSMLKETVQDASFSELYAALDSGDVDKAFEKAHLLKGVLGNLELTPMYRAICPMVEILRSGTIRGTEIWRAELERRFGELERILGEVNDAGKTRG